MKKQKFELITLTAKRVKETSGPYKGLFKTEFYRADGNLLAVFAPNITQPKKDAEYVVINGCNFKIKWLDAIEIDELLKTIKK